MWHMMYGTMYGNCFSHDKLVFNMLKNFGLYHVYTNVIILVSFMMLNICQIKYMSIMKDIPVFMNVFK